MTSKDTVKDNSVKPETKMKKFASKKIYIALSVVLIVVLLSAVVTLAVLHVNQSKRYNLKLTSIHRLKVDILI